MDISKIEACYFPTSTVFIDDNSKFLSKLILRIDLLKSYPKVFYNPRKALEFLQEYKFSPFTNRCISRPEEIHFDQRIVDINIRKIREEIYNPNRFDEISVIVVDYSMPGLNGLEFCKKLKNSPNTFFKILMLTGEADQTIAINAFNEGLIDKFIYKDTSDFEYTINLAIHELQHEYFLDLSKNILESLTQDFDHPMINWLDELAFIQLFNQLQQEYAFTEYYLTDAFGSFMFLDDEGQPSWLVVKSEEEMQAAYEVAEASDFAFPSQMLEEMKQRKKVLYLHHTGGLSDDPQEASASLHPATPLVGEKTTYYYSFIKNPKAYPLKSDQLLSYKVYREQQATKDL